MKFKMGNSETKQLDYQKIRYEDIKNNIKPYDMILFKDDSFISTLISKFQKMALGNGDFTHSAIILNGKILGFNDNPDKLYLWECVLSGQFTDGITDIYGKEIFAVQLRDFDKVIEKYIKNSSNNKFVCWMQLNKKYNFNRMKEKTIKLYKETLYKPFDLELLNMASVLHPNFQRITPVTTTKFYCSQFVAYILQQVNLIPEEINTAKIAPVDFVYCDKINIYNKPYKLI
jgi:hypothetical protein